MKCIVLNKMFIIYYCVGILGFTVHAILSLRHLPSRIPRVDKRRRFVLQKKKKLNIITIIITIRINCEKSFFINVLKYYGKYTIRNHHPCNLPIQIIMENTYQKKISYFIDVIIYIYNTFLSKQIRKLQSYNIIYILGSSKSPSQVILDIVSHPKRKIEMQIEQYLNTDKKHFTISSLKETLGK